MTLEIRPLDVRDAAQLAAWHATFRAGHAFGRSHPSTWMLEEMRAQFLNSGVGERIEPFSGHLDGILVVTGMLTLPLMDNQNLGYVDVSTHPDHRRQGHGSRMLEHLTARAQAEGRTTLGADASWPYDAPADGVGTPNADFLTEHGFSFALGDVKRALELPVDAALLDRLVDDVAGHHADYTLRQFAGPVPEDIVDSFGDLIGTLMVEAPMGDLDFEPEVYDAARIRADEAVFAESGRTKYTTVALAADGTVVAYSELVIPKHDPQHAYQWGTLVRPEHRGHRLGMATKAHNLRFLQQELSEPRTLYTYNAEVNDHMVAVNTALGFRPVERLGEFQKKF